MNPTFKTPNDVIKAAMGQGPGFLPNNLPPAVKDKASKIFTYDDLVASLENDAKMPKEVAETSASSVMLASLEKFGINPEEWKFTVNPGEMTTKVYGAEQWENARKFNATWSDVAEIALLASSVFGLVTLAGGAVIATGTVAAVSLALRAGQGFKAASTLLQLGAMKGIKWLSIPAGLATIGRDVASQANTEKSTTGDLEGYLLQGAIKSEQLLNGNGGTGTGNGTGYAQIPKTRATTYTTAKPKLFTGIIYNGQVGKFSQFMRSVDDSITSDEDLKNDVEINLIKYLSTIPNNLTYAIQIKNSPNDENGMPRSGTWCTLSIYLTNQFHKRIFIDEILLGPVDPYVYYPESQKVEALQYEVPKLVKFEDLHPVDHYTGQERLVDTAGNIITDVLKDGTRAVAGTSVVASSGQTVANITAGIEKAIPNSISAEGVSQHNQPPLFGTLYRVKGNEGLMFNPYPELYTEAEQVLLSPSSSKFDDNEKKLKEHGVNTAQVRGFQFHDLEPWYKLPQRTATFAEFFGVAQVSGTFPKQVTVTVDKLNVRAQATSQSATAGSMQLVRGDVFTAVALVEGEAVSGNNKWYKSSLGHFVWSGGAS